MQKDFVKAKAVAKSVYEMGKEGGGSTYELMKDYSKIFSIDNQRNSELILAIPCDGTKAIVLINGIVLQCQEIIPIFLLLQRVVIPIE